MKTSFTILLVALLAATGTRLRAQTLNWGNTVGGPVVTSAGAPIDESFVFELGAFFNDFVPDENNTDQWLSNWRVFDAAVYDQDFGFSTSTVYIENDVTSSNPAASTLSFAGLNAYIWIRNDSDPVPGSEWLLTRSDSWVFPAVGGDCCDTDVISWSVTDLDSNDDPNWGRHFDQVGPGVVSSPGGTTGLQTHTFVPEPSAALLTIVAGFGWILRRRRSDG